MSNKIGRNAPCPCGSGKKYKKCCLNKGFDFRPVIRQLRDEVSYTESYIVTHDKTNLLNQVIELQLNPENHGANVRIERLANLLVKHMDNGNIPVKIEDFRALLDKEYSYDHNEDLPINFFSEPVLYIGGNYQVFSGIASHAVDILTRLLNAVYSYDQWPEGFQERVEKGALLILTLADLLAKKAKIEGYVEQGAESGNEFVYSNAVGDYSFTMDEVAQVLFRYNIPGQVYRYFVVNDHMADFDMCDPDHSPLLEHPIVEYKNRSYLLLLSNEVDCLNKFILNCAEEFGCSDLLTKLIHNSNFEEIREACYMMGWKETHTLCSTFNEYMMDALYQMDTNWYVHVCYIHDKGADWRKEMFQNAFIDKHIKLVSEEAKTIINRDDDYCLMTMVLYASMGETMFIMTPESSSQHYLLRMPLYPFLELVKTESWNHLSLLHFAKAMYQYEKEQVFQIPSEPIDLYSLYKSRSESFYLSDKERPNIIYAEPNMGCSLLFEGKKKRNEHGTLMIKDAHLVAVPVANSIESTPIYRPLYPKFHAISLESYRIPIWTTCHQEDVSGPTFFNVANAIAFWLYKLTPYLNVIIEESFDTPLTIVLRFTENAMSVENSLPQPETPIEPFWHDGQLVVIINGTTISSMTGGTNEGERKLISPIVHALAPNLSDNEIQQILDKSIPLGPMKMFLVTDTGVNAMIDPRWIAKPEMISKATTGALLDDLKNVVAESGLELKASISEKNEKIEFLNAIVSGYIDKLKVYGTQFDGKNLLIQLMSRYESLIQKREHDKVIKPAQHFCFGTSADKAQELILDEQNLTVTGLALRCLIEYFTALPPRGRRKVGSEEIDYMMALMRDIECYGSISNYIRFGMSDHTIDLLPSGRYGIHDDDFEEKMNGFLHSYQDEMNIRLLELFESRFRLPSNASTPQPDDSTIPISEQDEAFLADWGFSLTQFAALTYICTSLCFREQTSVLSMPIDEFKCEILKSGELITPGTLDALLGRCSMIERDVYFPAENSRDYFPWEYNRDYSYLRRFIVRYKDDDGEYCIFGLRNSTSALHQLLHTLHEGRLAGVQNKSALHTLVGRFAQLKGDVFNESVRELLKRTSSWHVLDYEPKIEKGRPFFADDNYGDIDVFAYDDKNHIVYNVECKDTSQAKNSREMKVEMDNYLGRYSEDEEKFKKYQEKSLLGKHLRRHKWMVQNAQKVKELVNSNHDVTIHSILVTSSVLPVTFLRELDLPMPVISYSEIEHNGAEIIVQKCKEFYK